MLYLRCLEIKVHFICNVISNTMKHYYCLLICTFTTRLCAVEIVDASLHFGKILYHAVAESLISAHSWQRPL